LPCLYMETVDAVATRSGQTGSREYVKGFYHEVTERDGKAEAVVEKLAQQLQKNIQTSGCDNNGLVLLQANNNGVILS